MQEFRPTERALDYLLSPEGAALLDELTGSGVDEHNLLQHTERLRRALPADVVAAALDQVLLRRRARAKFDRAEQMFFTREALEQASAEVVSRHRAQRYDGFAAVADLCCGIGGDTLALAARSDVLAVDLDPLRLRMARANAAAYRVGDHVRTVCEDARRATVPAGHALWADPSRRVEGRRVFSLSHYEPPLRTLLSLAARAPGAGIKLSPGVDYGELAREVGEAAHEVEVISVGGEAREAVLWMGSLRSCARRATLLPGGHTITRQPLPTPVAVTGVGPYLYEPDAAVIRAHLVAHLACALGATQIDPQIAYLTSDARIDSPFVTGYAVEEVFPFSRKAIRARLRRRAVGELVIKKRGMGIDPEEFRRRLDYGGGTDRVVLVLTRVRDRPTAVICRPVAA